MSCLSLPGHSSILWILTRNSVKVWGIETARSKQKVIEAEVIQGKEKKPENPWARQPTQESRARTGFLQITARAVLIARQTGINEQQSSTLRARGHWMDQ
ncbi:hypothetical protein SAY86_007156 [Trapa natans]|uniref:Uncharacterized protein n=1 Tax=Trapa natans TaxID=22666 RepID=A0AAN7LMX7_TRANT|nr:hypothetical protein SAY86_007156 [Trapa natans]